MPSEVWIAVIIAIPVIIFPIAFVWFINVTGLWSAWKESRVRERRLAKARREATVKVLNK